jgi:hypothetical protein
MVSTVFLIIGTQNYTDEHRYEKGHNYVDFKISHSYPNVR